jgi:predicted SnoaL-like aldol condensation-catalyzing enzyme
MTSLRKQKIYNLLKGIETGDPDSVKVVNEEKYIQHNPQTEEGGEGLAQLFSRLSKTNPKVEIVRLFEDGDYVFGHTIYDFSSVRIGFEVFRYDGDQVVEHWDNIQPRNGDMVGGTTEVKDFDETENNRKIIGRFLQDLFIDKNYSFFSTYIDTSCYCEHSTFMDILEKMKVTNYHVTHRILAQGNFVLAVNEGTKDNIQHSFYDLFRIENGKIVEHWDTIEKVPPKSEWRNNNGKF